MTATANNAELLASLLDLAGVADHLGLSIHTVRAYRRDGRLPEPDVTLGQSPAWTVKTIEAWQQSRPGQGARTDLKGTT